MTEATRDANEKALRDMKDLSSLFYSRAVWIKSHAFIEFTGLMNEFINICEEAHKQGIDFTKCNKHSGKSLPMQGHQIDYINEKLECIFTGRVMMKEEEDKDG